MNAILSTAYLPTLQYVSKFIAFERVFIEIHENYCKQSYRNRTTILSANGPLDLSIPIKKNSGNKIPIADVEIDYDTHWQKIHWKAIESAYGCSAFFLFYKDDLFPFYHTKFINLFDYNTQLLRLILNLIKIKKEIFFTTEFKDEYNDIIDYRYSIHPKTLNQHIDKHFKPVPYYQVFNEKHGFVSNLGILDLLFNEGPGAYDIIKSSIVTI